MSNDKITLALPKGRMFNAVVHLLEQCGLEVSGQERSYRPRSSDPRVALKILKPQNIPPLVELGRHDLGFTGRDWVVETSARVMELYDPELDPVTLVAAAPTGWDSPAPEDAHTVVVASEYESIAREYLARKGWKYRFVRSYGATEVFPPDDADLIVDNTASGQTLKENGLRVIDEIMQSSTRFIASEESMQRESVRRFAQNLVLLMRGVREASRRVILEMNVANGNMDKLVGLLPAMKNPTIQELADGSHALKAAVPVDQVAGLIPLLKELGATDILEYPVRKVIP